MTSNGIRRAEPRAVPRPRYLDNAWLVAPVLAIKNCAAGYGGLFAWHAQAQGPGPGEDERQDCQGQVKSGWSSVDMLHTWPNAAYLGDLNFGKKFGKKVWKKVWKMSKWLWIFLKMTGRSLCWVNFPATNLVSWISTRAYITIYNGIKIVVPSQ